MVELYYKERGAGLPAPGSGDRHPATYSCSSVTTCMQDCTPIDEAEVEPYIGPQRGT